MMHFDATAFLAINKALSGSVSSAFFSFVTYLGDGFVLALIVLPVFYFFDRVRFRKHVLAMVLFAAFSGLVVTGAKIAVDRQRPPEYFGNLGVEIHLPGAVPVDRSFPSGHTQIAFAIAVYLSFLYRPYAALFLIIAGLVGLSRIALGVHFPFDVVVGACIGTVFSVVGFRWATRKQKQPT
jgi:undecaprenyl-diphosphatase